MGKIYYFRKVNLQNLKTFLLLLNRAYVQDVASNGLVECEIHKVNSASELSSILKNSRFSFDWKTELVFEVYALRQKNSGAALGLISFEAVPSELRIEIKLLESSKENIGRGKKYRGIAGDLIAFACRESFLRGFYGFVSLIPKTELIDHYISEYGFVQAGRHLVTELVNSRNLIDKYLR